MSKHTQAAIENKLNQRLAQVEAGKKTPEQAFSIFEDWTIQLGERKAFLHPNLKQWMWYDRLHDEWVFSGCATGEAILVNLGGLAGIKKLPEPDDVNKWCIYKQGDSLKGPVRIEEIQKKIASGKLSKDILLWSTQATEWLSLEEAAIQKIIS